MKLRAQGPARGGEKILHTARGQGHSFVALHTKIHRNDVIADVCKYLLTITQCSLILHNSS